jgi:integrase
VAKKRRGNGEGTIYKRKDGRYEARYTVHTANGPKRKAIYDSTRAGVAGKLTMAMADRDQGMAFDAGKLTLGEYLTRWLEDSVRGNVRHRTLDSYRMHVRCHLVPALGHIKLKALSSAHVQALYRAKLDTGLAPSTVRYTHAVLHRALKQAVRWGLIARNVCEAVDLPKLERAEVYALSPTQVKTLFSAARDDRLETLYVMAIHTGLRMGELLGLRWGDVDFEAGKLRVARQLQRVRGGGGLSFSPTKNSSRRTIKLTDSAVKALKRHHARQAEEKLKLGSLYRDQDLIFASTVGTPLEASNITNRSFKPLLGRAGLPEIRFHDLRHTAATLLLTRGVHPKLVQELLGHATITQTMDTYSHVLPGMGDQTANAMESALLQP